MRESCRYCSDAGSDVPALFAYWFEPLGCWLFTCGDHFAEIITRARAGGQAGAQAQRSAGRRPLSLVRR